MIETDKETLRSYLIENGIILPAFQHYGGKSGYQDYGIHGFRLRSNVLSLWRQMFTKDLPLDEVETPMITPKPILQASGHIDRFTDPVIELLNGDKFRADHIVKEHDCSLNVDTWTCSQLEEYINDNKLFDEKVTVKLQSLMLNINEHEYLRPELAQGIFVNFKQYLSLKGKLPFGIAQVGKSFRGEIAPRPFVRMREFTQAEIEYFFDPKNPTINQEITDCVLPILSAEQQKISSEIQYLNSSDIMKENKILLFFLVKIYEFALRIGLNKDKLRFRQHCDGEMAHYASDCWDLEGLIDNSWLECVGCANRQSFDLTCHGKISPIKVKRPGKKCKKLKLKPNLKEISKIHRQDIQRIKEFLLNLNFPDSENVPESLDLDGLIISSDCYTSYNVEEDEEYVPHVIEPSFGIDRLIYATCAHNLVLKPDKELWFSLTLPKEIAIFDLAIVSVINNTEYHDFIKKLEERLRGNHRILTDYSSIKIGKKYLRADRIGVPIVITIDSESFTNNTVTFRDRNTTEQITVNIDDLERMVWWFRSIIT
jgi:glycyl-tRNA synthetase